MPLGADTNRDFWVPNYADEFRIQARNLRMNADNLDKQANAVEQQEARREAIAKEERVAAGPAIVPPAKRKPLEDSGNSQVDGPPRIADNPI